MELVSTAEATILPAAYSVHNGYGKTDSAADSLNSNPDGTLRQGKTRWQVAIRWQSVDQTGLNSLVRPGRLRLFVLLFIRIKIAERY